ncbi:MAG: alpha/beta hydrolase [Prevotellaceae bacterium]|jgi:acetyl esterase/lipase|nr:alpha/beta hydrolase [Prevotellaceae bacterium]
MKKIAVLFLLSAMFFSGFSQQKIKLWQDNPAFRQKWSELAVFLPEKPDSSGVSVIICPGGSYVYLDMKNEGYSVAKYLNSKGITAFVLKYRTAWQNNHHPAMIEDLQRAMEIVKNNAETYKIDPEKVGVMGFSAGGHLAGMAAEYFDKQYSASQYQTVSNENLVSGEQKDSLNTDVPNTAYKPCFAAMIYPVVSMEDSICHKKSRKNLLGKKYSPELAKQMSLEQNVRPDMPPVFLLHCTGDKTVDYRNSVLLDKALTAQNVPHKFLLLAENGHGFGIKPKGKATGWIEVFLEWLFGSVMSSR